MELVFNHYITKQTQFLILEYPAWGTGRWAQHLHTEAVDNLKHRLLISYPSHKGLLNLGPVWPGDYEVGSCGSS